jgi:cellulase
MRFSSILCTLFTAELVVGHAFVYQVHINGKPQGRGVAVRKGHSNDPVKNVNSNEMTCNKNPQPSPQTLSVKPGDRVRNDQLAFLVYLTIVDIYPMGTQQPG